MGSFVIDSVYLVIEDDAFVIKKPNDLLPNQYEGVISFGEQSCGKGEESIIVDLLYSNEVIAQRWGDVLAVKNEDYNGGYQFVAFQWYKNGNPIEGATSSICYLSEGVNLWKRLK